VVLSCWGFEEKVKSRVPKELKISMISKKKLLCNLLDDHIQGSQQNTHYPKEKLPKIITYKWKFCNLLEAPNTLLMKDLFVTKLESNEGK